LALALAEKLGGVDHQCRFHAGLSRPAHHHRAPDAGGRSSACRTCSTVTSTPQRIFRSAAGAPRPPHALASTNAKIAGPAIVVGGTGLYFKALARGLAAVPPVPAEIRDMVRARLASDGVAALHAELKAARSGGAARLMPGDRARIARALEVVLATGRSLLSWHEEGEPASLDASRAAKVFLMPGREGLLRRIEARFDAMIAAGAIEEVRALAARNLDPGSAGDEGARRAVAHAAPSRRDHALAEAVEGGKRDTRQYTKRQATWFRHQLPDFVWVEPEQALLAAVEAQLRVF
jgi:tRNA dimethylallyltransferase